MVIDTWHYARKKLAEQVIGMFGSGLSSALVFFAPRRMGKTEFLRKDIMPLAESLGWKAFYFSFLDVGAEPAIEFSQALAEFIEKITILTKTRSLLRRVSKVSGEAGSIKAGVEFVPPSQEQRNIKTLIAQLAEKNKVLLLMDEVQTLAQNSSNTQFIAALRTALDIHKDTIKVIFTGSSQEGLRRMFSQAKAPFFHFGQNLPFPELDKKFTDHLAEVFAKVSARELDREVLWATFNEMQRVPQLARSLVERLVLNPELDLAEAKNQLLSEVFKGRAFADSWEGCSVLERLMLREISQGNTNLFSVAVRNKLAKMLGIQSLAVSSVQSAIRTLQRKNIIGRFPERGGYFIEDPNFKEWLLQISESFESPKDLSARHDDYLYK